LQISQQPITPTTMPVYTVVPRVVNEAYAKQIGSAFGLSGQVLASPDGRFYYMAGGTDGSQQVRIDRASGAYFFQNLNDLWTDPERVRQNLPVNGQSAQAVSAVFLRERAKTLPGSFNFDFEIQPTVELEGPTGGLQLPGSAIAADPQQPMNYALSYARTLDIGGQKVSVVGPGSRLKTYIGENGAIIGMKGGWRDVAQNTGIQATVPIRSAADAWTSFVTTPTIALALPPLADRYDRTGKPAPTLAYYEQPTMDGQVELIPVWLFVADLYDDTPATPQQAATSYLVASDVQIYVPAAASPTSTPKAQITSPSSGISLAPGAGIALTGSATGGTAPYVFTWSSSSGSDLGTGASISTSLEPDLRDGSGRPVKIILTVRDANGQVSTAAIDVTVPPRIALPLIVQ
jgi:hypothetical protein